jgi:hypothetical protein
MNDDPRGCVEDALPGDDVLAVHVTKRLAAILLGAAIEDEILEVADRNAGIVAMLKKKYLPAVGPPAGASRP